MSYPAFTLRKTLAGLVISQNATTKCSFHGATPVAQRSGAAQAEVSGTAGGTYSTNEQTMLNDVVALANELRAALVEKGLIKGGA